MPHITNLLSLLAGKAAYCRLPAPLGRLSVRAFAALYRIDPSTASLPLADYKTIGEFFVRDLKPGLRPIGKGLVSPVDGILKGYGSLENGLLEQVKGRHYSAADLLGDEEKAGEYRGGFYFHFYLSPADYHHVHSPVNGVISGCKHIPGSLWPVNDMCVRRLDRLFVRNERVVIYLNTDAGSAAVVMIGALNVGGIKVCFQPNLQRGACCGGAFEHPVRAGDRIGTFYLGSSVVVLLPPGRHISCPLAAGAPVLYGQQVAD